MQLKLKPLGKVEIEDASNVIDELPSIRKVVECHIFEVTLTKLVAQLHVFLKKISDPPP